MTLQQKGLFALLILVLGPAATAEPPLAQTDWRMAEFRSMDDAVGVIRPSQASHVEVSFGEDGALSLRLDCNRGRADWSIEAGASETSGSIRVGPVAGTRALCPGAEFGERFARDLPMIRGFLLRGDRLYLSLLADAGVYVLDRMPRITSVEAGGPRVFQVAGAPNGLNLRAGPSSSAEVIASLENGTLLDNLGCADAEDRLWCCVQRFGGGPVGHVAAAFLEPAMGPGGTAAAGPDDSALRAGQGDFDATGRLRCDDDWCEFGVARAGGGFDTVVVSRPDGAERIFFRLGRATGTSTSEAAYSSAFSVRREGDDQLIEVGRERYVVPDAVILGG